MRISSRHVLATTGMVRKYLLDSRVVCIIIIICTSIGVTNLLLHFARDAAVAFREDEAPGS